MDSPKLLTLQAPTVRNQRTLVWLQSQDVNGKWNRWDGVVVGKEAYRHWKDAGANITCRIDLDVVSDDDFAELYKAAKEVSLVLLPQTVLIRKSQAFWDENFDNVLNLNQLHESYPFLREEWDGSAEDAVTLCAWLCRYQRFVDGPVTVKETRQHPELVRVWNQRPPEFWLFTQFFVPGSKPRQKELIQCLRHNAACSWIDRIVLLNERDESAAWQRMSGREKIQQVIIGQRLRYGDFIRFVQSSNVPNETIVALCNADIYLDEEAAELWKVNMEDRMLALLRWDDVGDGPHASSTRLFGPRADSQDTWIFWSDSIKARVWKWGDVDFMLGQPGCDNAFAGVMLRNRFLITNPALSVKTYHLHNSNLRTYNKSDYIRSPLYINLVPTYLIDTRQEIVPKGSPQCICNALASFEVKSSSLSNEITFCTMLEKEGRYKWEPQVENHAFEPAIPIYRWKDAAVTPNGLVYDLYSIYTGRHAMANNQEESRYNYWKGAQADLFTPLHSRDRMIAIPLSPTEDVFSSFDRYVTYYFSRVLRVLKEYPGACFWAPPSFGSQLMSLFSLDFDPHQMVPYDGQMGCWAKEVIGFLPGPSTAEISNEEVDTLRGLWPGYEEPSDPKKCVVMVDDVLTEACAREMLAPLTNGEWIVETTTPQQADNLEAFRGASLYLCFGGKGRTFSARAWALPRGAKVVEFQQELKLDGESQHLFHMADTQAWVMMLSKGSVADVQDQMATQLRKWWGKQMA